MEKRKPLDILIHNFSEKYVGIYIWGVSYTAEMLYSKLRRNGEHIKGIISMNGGGIAVGQNILRASDVLPGEKNVGVIVVNGNSREEIEKVFPERKDDFLYVRPAEINEEVRNNSTEDGRIVYYDYSVPFKVENAWMSRFLYHYFPDMAEPFHIYGVFGNNRQVRIPQKGIKIFHSTETLGEIPNYFRNPKTSQYNHCLEYVDLSISFENLCEPNHFQLPPFVYATFIPSNHCLEDIKETIRKINESPHYEITEQCAAINQHDNWGTRTMIYENVKDLFDVKFAGSWNHNTDDLIKKFKNDKIKYLQHFRFNICAENMNWEDYCTEKLIDCFKANCIPLYYGSNNCPFPELINQNAIIFFSPNESNENSRKLIKDLMDYPKVYEEFISQSKFMPHAAEYIYETFFQGLYKRIKYLIEVHQRVRNTFSFLGMEQIARNTLRHMDVKKNIILPKRSGDYNFYRYYLSVANARYCLHLSDLRANYDKFTVGVFDFKNQSKVKYVTASTREDVFFSFEVGEEIEQWAICIYAGIAGHTKDQSLIIGTFEVNITPFQPVRTTEDDLAEEYEVVEKTNPYAREVYWAEVYNSAIKESEWLKHKAIVPGGMDSTEAGYAFLCALYQVLDSTHPQNILEMRLGQDTKLTCQYARYYGAGHRVIDHNMDFVQHFRQHWPWMSKQTSIYVAKKTFMEMDGVLFSATGEFKKIIEHQKFDLIILKRSREEPEKPYGDILFCLKELLAEQFVILLDHGNASPEQQLIEKIIALLKENGLSVSQKVYACGERDAVMVASSAWSQRLGT